MITVDKNARIKQLLARVETLKPSKKSQLSFTLDLEGTDSIPNKEKDIKPLIAMVGKLKSYFDSKNASISDEMRSEFEKITSLMREVESKSADFTKSNSDSLVKELKSLKKEIADNLSEVENNKGISDVEIKELRNKLTIAETDVDIALSSLDKESGERKKNEATIKSDITSIKERLKKLEEELKDKLDKTNRDFIERFSGMESKLGGGSMNRQIKVDGTDVLKSYTDINLIGGSGVTITTANDDTDKNVDITFSSAAAVNTFTGSVDGINQVFVFDTAPSALSVDGVVKQRISSDSTVNWTVVGTTVTLAVAPNFDLLALN